MSAGGASLNEVDEVVAQHLGPEFNRLVVTIALQKAQDLPVQKQGVEVEVVIQKREQLAPIQNGDHFVRSDEGIRTQRSGRDKIGGYGSWSCLPLQLRGQRLHRHRLPRIGIDRLPVPHRGENNLTVRARRSEHTEVGHLRPVCQGRLAEKPLDRLRLLTGDDACRHIAQIGLRPIDAELVSTDTRTPEPAAKQLEITVMRLGEESEESRQDEQLEAEGQEGHVRNAARAPALWPYRPPSRSHRGSHSQDCG